MLLNLGYKTFLRDGLNQQLTWQTTVLSKWLFLSSLVCSWQAVL